MPRIADIRQEAGPLLELALPVVAGELAWMGMGVVDTMMLGRLSPEALAAAAVGRIILMTVAMLGLGLLLGLDTLVSRAYGAGNREDCRHSLIQGLVLALLLSLPLLLLHRSMILALPWFEVDERVQGAAAGYMRSVGWSMGPFLVYTAFRRYLQAVHRVRAVMVALVSANLINAVANWILIFGKLGFPPLGAVGSGWATTGAMTYMALFLGAIAHVELREAGLSLWSRWRIDPVRLRELFALGAPASVQLVLEVGVFGLATMLAARFEPVAIAAHQVALTAASVTYMVPLGISSAAAVRVGYAIGQRDPHRATVAGWTAILAGAAFMGVAALVFVTLPRQVLRIFTDDATVIGAGAGLLLVAAAFQLFDGVAISTIGALRGAGDTRTAMIWSSICYWALALPVAWWLAFRQDMGVLGLWIGLCVGVMTIATVLVYAWSRQARIAVVRRATLAR